MKAAKQVKPTAVGMDSSMAIDFENLAVGLDFHDGSFVDDGDAGRDPEAFRG